MAGNEEIKEYCNDERRASSDEVPNSVPDNRTLASGSSWQRTLGSHLNVICKLGFRGSGSSPVATCAALNATHGSWSGFDYSCSSTLLACSLCLSPIVQPADLLAARRHRRLLRRSAREHHSERAHSRAARARARRCSVSLVRLRLPVAQPTFGIDMHCGQHERWRLDHLRALHSYARIRIESRGVQSHQTSLCASVASQSSSTFATRSPQRRCQTRRPLASSSIARLALWLCSRVRRASTRAALLAACARAGRTRARHETQASGSPQSRESASVRLLSNRCVRMSADCCVEQLESQLMNYELGMCECARKYRLL